MVRQRLNGDMKRLAICVSGKLNWTIRNLAGKRNHSISRVVSEYLQDGLRRDGYLKPDDEL